MKRHWVPDHQDICQISSDSNIFVENDIGINCTQKVEK